MPDSGVKWNVMVYQAGDNNLSEEMIWALKDMIDALAVDEAGDGAGDEVRLFVQFDPRGATPRRFAGKNLTGIGDLRELNEDDIKEAVEGTPWRQSMCESLKKVKQNISVLIPVGSPHLDSAGAVLTQIGNAVADPDDIASATQGLSELKDSIEKKIKADIEEADVEKALKQKIELLELQRCVEAASRILEGAENLGQFKGFLKENSAAPEMIQQFFEACISEVPEKDSKYLMVLSGHGSGAVGDFLTDDGTLSSLSIPSLATILQNVQEQLAGNAEGDAEGAEGDAEKKKIDILGMESCLMSMAEVCYEIREHVSYLVGSEGLMLNTGWPYERILGQIKGDPSAEGLAEQIVKEYTSYYTDYEIGGLSTDLSACSLKGMGHLAKKFGELVDLLKKKLIKKDEKQELDLQLHPLWCKILLAHWDAQSYQDEQYVDLWDFCERLKAHCRYKKDEEINDQEIIDGCERVQEALADIVVISGHTGAEFQHSTGLSIYFPWTADDFSPAYKDLGFSGDTGWGEFLEELFLKSSRRARYDEKNNEEKDLLHYDVVDNPVLLQLAGPYRNPKLGSKRNPKLGSKRNPKLGSKRYSWPIERGTMKNPPRGFYASRLKWLEGHKCVPA